MQTKKLCVESLVSVTICILHTILGLIKLAVRRTFAWYSPCHGFGKVAAHTGGFYHLVCRHGVSVTVIFMH